MHAAPRTGVVPVLDTVLENVRGSSAARKDFCPPGCRATAFVGSSSAAQAAKSSGGEWCVLRSATPCRSARTGREQVPVPLGSSCAIARMPWLVRRGARSRILKTNFAPKLSRANRRVRRPHQVGTTNRLRPVRALQRPFARLHDYTIRRLHSCTVARLHSCTAARPLAVRPGGWSRFRRATGKLPESADRRCTAYSLRTETPAATKPAKGLGSAWHMAGEK